VTTHALRRIALGITTALLAGVAAARAGTISDPTGDTFASGPDIVSVQSNSSGSSVVFSVQFAGAIAPPSAFQSNSLYGFIDIDKDKNAATGGNAPWGGNVPGGNSWINFFSPPTSRVALGDEFFVDLGSEGNHPGQVDVDRTLDLVTTGTVAITYMSTSFSFTLPTSLLGGGNNDYNFGVLVGTASQITDQAPNGPLPASVLPEPSSICLCMPPLFVALAYGWRRRRLRSPAILRR
jgi:hypothetical protein